MCAVRGDLGCLGGHAHEAGYRAGDFAGRLRVTPRALRLAFHAGLGISLKNWLVQVRAGAVRHRLHGCESIKVIALAVGFSHSKELSREFRKVYGMTPSGYREQNRVQSPEVRSQKSLTGDRRQETGDRRQETGSRAEWLGGLRSWLARLAPDLGRGILPRV